MRRRRPTRTLRVAALVVALLASGGSAAGGTVAWAPRDGAGPGGPAATSFTAVVYAPPIAPPTVVRGFDPPAGPYGPGHRGVDLAARSGAPVAAAADGTVTFAGPVAGRGVVVIAHADGIRTEYEPVRPRVARGAVVHRGQVIGTVAGRHTGCSGGCLHWGARRGEVYLDPMALLRPLGPVRLLPWSGPSPGP